MNNYPDQDIANVGFLGFVGGAVGGLWSLVAGEGSGSQYFSHGKGELSQIIQNIDVQARHRTILLAMQDQRAIRQFLLDFITSMRLNSWETRDLKKDAYKAMQLGVDLLSAVIACYKEEMTANNSHADLKKHLNINLKSILEILEGNRKWRVSATRLENHKQQAACEEATFSKFYEVGLKRKLTPVESYAIEGFFHTTTVDELEKYNLSLEVGVVDQRKFLDYCKQALTKGSQQSNAVQAFGNACAAIFDYYKQALQDAKYQALCDAVDTDVNVVKAFLDKHSQDMSLNLNQRFKWHTQEPVYESDEDAAKNTDDNTATETVLFKVIRDRPDETIIRFLCEKGANVNLRDSTKFHRTPLHLAIGLDRAFLVPLLIEKGADPSLCDARGCTPLSNLVDKLHQHFSQPHNLRDGLEKWMIAAWDDLYEPMKCLVSRDKVNRKDAIIKNNPEALVDKDFIQGATSAFKFFVYLFRLVNIEGQSQALEIAAARDFQALSNDTKPTKSYEAKYSMQDFIDLLMESGADLNETDHLGNTLLHHLVGLWRYGNSHGVMTEKAAVSWVYFLCSQSTMANAKVPFDEQTPLHKRIPFDKKNNVRETPITLARHYGWGNFADVLQRLLNQSVESKPARSYISRQR